MIITYPESSVSNISALAAISFAICMFFSFCSNFFLCMRVFIRVSSNPWPLLCFSKCSFGIGGLPLNRGFSTTFLTNFGFLNFFLCNFFSLRLLILTSYVITLLSSDLNFFFFVSDCSSSSLVKYLGNYNKNLYTCSFKTILRFYTITFTFSSHKNGVIYRYINKHNYKSFVCTFVMSRQNHNAYLSHFLLLLMQLI